MSSCKSMYSESTSNNDNQAPSPLQIAVGIALTIRTQLTIAGVRMLPTIVHIHVETCTTMHPRVD